MLYVCMCVTTRVDCMCVEREPYLHGQRRRGERGEREGRDPDSFCRCKMRFQKVAATFPCAAHANSFTRVPGRNAAYTFYGPVAVSRGGGGRWVAGCGWRAGGEEPTKVAFYSCERVKILKTVFCL